MKSVIETTTTKQNTPNTPKSYTTSKMQSVRAILRKIKTTVSPVLESTWYQLCKLTRFVLNRNQTVSGPNETNYLVVAGERASTQMAIECIKMGLSYGASGVCGTMTGIYWRDTTKKILEDGLKGKSWLVKLLSYGPNLERVNKAYATGYQWGSAFGGFGAAKLFDLAVYCTKMIIRYKNILEARSFQQVLESDFSCKACGDWDMVNIESKVPGIVARERRAECSWLIINLPFRSLKSWKTSKGLYKWYNKQCSKQNHRKELVLSKDLFHQQTCIIGVNLTTRNDNSDNVILLKSLFIVF